MSESDPERIRVEVLSYHQHLEEIAASPIKVQNYMGDHQWFLTVGDSSDHAIRIFSVTEAEDGVPVGLAEKMSIGGELTKRGLATRLTKEMLRLHPEVSEWRTSARSIDGLLLWKALESQGIYSSNPAQLRDLPPGVEYWDLNELLKLQSIDEAQFPYLYPGNRYRSVRDHIEYDDLGARYFTTSMSAPSLDDFDPLIVQGYTLLDGYDRLLEMRKQGRHLIYPVIQVPFDHRSP